MSDPLKPIRMPPRDNPEAIKQRAYMNRRRAWSKAINWPWPDAPEEDRPPPGTLDLPVNYPEG